MRFKKNCFGPAAVLWLVNEILFSRLPSFGSDAAGPARDGAVDVGEVGVIPRVVPRANLQIKTQKGLCWLKYFGSSGRLSFFESSHWSRDSDHHMFVTNHRI